MLLSHCYIRKRVAVSAALRLWQRHLMGPYALEWLPQNVLSLCLVSRNHQGPKCHSAGEPHAWTWTCIGPQSQSWFLPFRVYSNPPPLTGDPSDVPRSSRTHAYQAVQALVPGGQPDKLITPTGQHSVSSKGLRDRGLPKWCRCIDLGWFKLFM